MFKQVSGRACTLNLSKAALLKGIGQIWISSPRIKVFSESDRSIPRVTRAWAAVKHWVGDEAKDGLITASKCLERNWPLDSPIASLKSIELTPRIMLQAKSKARKGERELPKTKSLTDKGSTSRSLFRNIFLHWKNTTPWSKCPKTNITLLFFCVVAVVAISSKTLVAWFYHNLYPCQSARKGPVGIQETHHCTQWHHGMDVYTIW